METILVNRENSSEDFVKKAKEILEKEGKVVIKGKSRDTVKAVDVAELLKKDGFKTGNIETQTEEEEQGEKTKRTSVITIEIQK